MSKPRRLGRGLEALLGKPAAEAASVPSQEISDPHVESGQPTHEPEPPASQGETLHEIDIYQIDRNPFQPREDFDDQAIQSLAESLSETGLIQPIVVRPIGDRFQLISGERRWRAATVAGWETIPARLLEADDRQVAEVAIVENVQRKDLNPLEKAASFQRYLQEFGCTQEELAGRVQVDRSTIANLIRLLELPEPVQHSIRQGEISQGHARALLPLGDETEQVQFCKRICAESLSVRATEELVKSAIAATDDEPLGVVSPDDSPTPAPRNRSEHLASLEQELRLALGTKVGIRESGKGRGRIEIHFTSHQEFDRLRAYLTTGTSNAQSHVG